MIPTPEVAAGTIRRGLAITVVALLGVLAVYVLAQGYTPIEARQGLAQKIFYVHAPSAWACLLAFSLTGVTGGLPSSTASAFAIARSAMAVGLLGDGQRPLVVPAGRPAVV
jgi:hypothetical protein